jgi:hypothetical protein
MDILRNRLNTFEFKTSQDKKIVKEFLFPILIIGTREEIKLRRALRRSLGETKKRVSSDKRKFEKILKEMRASLK